jgi:hypothetical protein
MPPNVVVATSTTISPSAIDKDRIDFWSDILDEESNDYPIII